MSEFYRLGLLGDPVEHSLSRPMQEAALAACGLEGEYRLLRTPPGTIRERLGELAEAGYRGLNVTVPLKEECFRLLAEEEASVSARAAGDALGSPLSPAARQLGAVNTLQRTGGRWRGHNSDSGGFRQALLRCPGTVRGRHVVILGAGGAARAVLAALLAEGAARIEIWNRSPARLARLLADFTPPGAADPGQAPVVVGLGAGRGRCPAGAQLIVQATSLGLDGADSLPPLPAQGESPPVMDLITHVTPWQEACRQIGCQTWDGREMLLWQGADAFKAWTGLPAPLQAMRAALFGS